MFPLLINLSINYCDRKFPCCHVIWLPFYATGTYATYAFASQGAAWFFRRWLSDVWHRTSQIFKTVYLTDPYDPIKRPRQFMPDASLIAGNLLKSAPQVVNHQL